MIQKSDRAREAVQLAAEAALAALSALALKCDGELAPEEWRIIDQARLGKVSPDRVRETFAQASVRLIDECLRSAARRLGLTR